MGLVRSILRDYFCRIGMHDYCGCGAPVSVDDALAAAAAGMYRVGLKTPPGIGTRGTGLLPGSTPEGVTACGAGVPPPEGVTPASVPDLAPPQSGSIVGPPYQTEEIDQDEFRNVGSTAADFIAILLPQLQKDIDILEVTIQPAAAGSFQLVRDGTPITAVYTLAANQPWSAPGLTLLRQQTLFLRNFSFVSTVFEVRWKWRV